MSKTKQTAEELVCKIDFPHQRKGSSRVLQTGVTPKFNSGASFKRLCFYAEKLRELGMRDRDIAGLFSDLYWDAVAEYELIQKSAPEQKASRNRAKQPAPRSRKTAVKRNE